MMFSENALAGSARHRDVRAALHVEIAMGENTL